MSSQKVLQSGQQMSNIIHLSASSKSVEPQWSKLFWHFIIARTRPEIRSEKKMLRTCKQTFVYRMFLKILGLIGSICLKLQMLYKFFAHSSAIKFSIILTKSQKVIVASNHLPCIEIGSNSIGWVSNI